MKNAILSLLLLGALGAGFLAGAWYNQRERVSAAGVHARKVLYYVDPMHPAYKSDKPGVAPDHDHGGDLRVHPVDFGSDHRQPGPEERRIGNALCARGAGVDSGIPGYARCPRAHEEIR